MEYKVAHPGTTNFSRNSHEGNIIKWFFCLLVLKFNVIYLLNTLIYYFSAIIELLSESDENLGLVSGRYHSWDDFDEDCVEFDDY